MKVAVFQFFPPTIWTPGGGETQLRMTAEALAKHGVEVEYFDIWHPTKNVDVLHVFGSTYQLSDFVTTAKKLGIRVVVSPIAYTDKPGWQWRGLSAISRLMPVPTVFTYRKRIYEAADLLVSGSWAEARQLAANFQIPANKFRVVYNAADVAYAQADPRPFIDRYGLGDFVLMVGRVSQHKGQLRLVEALVGEGIDVVFVGHPDPDDMAYYDRFKSVIQGKSWIRFLGTLGNGSVMLRSAYAAAKVHALPSLGECPGLVNLEAGFAGANVVATRSEPTYEHLGDFAWYCDPRSIASIRENVLEAYSAPRNHRGLREHLLKNFTWGAIAEKLIKVYRELM